jgi:hypothetical protein
VKLLSAVSTHASNSAIVMRFVTIIGGALATYAALFSPFEGWKGPFFCDAAVKKHRYAFAFREPWKPDAASFSTVTIGISQLEVSRAWL